MAQPAPNRVRRTLRKIPGVFDAALTVTGPGGSDTLVQPGLVEVLPPELKIEVGELTLTHEPQRVDFSDPCIDAETQIDQAPFSSRTCKPLMA
jgi:hypothetical protein